MNSLPATTYHLFRCHLRFGELHGFPRGLLGRDAPWSCALRAPMAPSSNLGVHALRLHHQWRCLSLTATWVNSAPVFLGH
eukprot:5303345-Pyramimonas_sp.AAC.1